MNNTDLKQNLRWRWCPYLEVPFIRCPRCGADSCTSTRGCGACRRALPVADRIVSKRLAEVVGELYGTWDYSGQPRYDLVDSDVARIAVRARLAEKFSLRPSYILGRRIKSDGD